MNSRKQWQQVVHAALVARLFRASLESQAELDEARAQLDDFLERVADEKIRNAYYATRRVHNRRYRGCEPPAG